MHLEDDLFHKLFFAGDGHEESEQVAQCIGG